MDCNLALFYLHLEEVIANPEHPKHFNQNEPDTRYTGILQPDYAVLRGTNCYDKRHQEKNSYSFVCPGRAYHRRRILSVSLHKL